MRHKVGQRLTVAADVAHQSSLESLLGRTRALMQHILHALSRLVGVLARISVKLGLDDRKTLGEADVHDAWLYLHVVYVAERSILWLARDECPHVRRKLGVVNEGGGRIGGERAYNDAPELERLAAVFDEDVHRVAAVFGCMHLVLAEELRRAVQTLRATVVNVEGQSNESSAGAEPDDEVSGELPMLLGIRARKLRQRWRRWHLRWGLGRERGW
mmetsp:Transcript_12174/g.31142  ORF Transcript_12174/g.31142 Transcript_12174/m.31142 type:complete len:215 (+) Transcript_12174:883-1527(+)